jgi:hypothetical protein
MNNFIFCFIIIGYSLFFEHPKDISGKWLVENVDASNAEAGMPAKQKAMVNKFLVEPFTHSTFDFKPDHHFYLSAEIPKMPKNDFWEYSAAEGEISIREYKDKNALIMQLSIVEKGDDIYFLMHGTGVILKMKRI